MSEPTSLCDRCGIEHEVTTTCLACGGVLCDECWSARGCPKDKVMPEDLDAEHQA